MSEQMDSLDEMLDTLLADLPQEPLPERVVQQVMMQFPTPAIRPFRLTLLDLSIAALVALIMGLLWLTLQMNIPAIWESITATSGWWPLSLILVTAELLILFATHFALFGKHSGR
jgi:hypothetical protein